MRHQKANCTIKASKIPQVYNWGKLLVFQSKKTHVKGNFFKKSLKLSQKLSPIKKKGSFPAPKKSADQGKQDNKRYLVGLSYQCPNPGPSNLKTRQSAKGSSLKPVAKTIWNYLGSAGSEKLRSLFGKYWKQKIIYLSRVILPLQDFFGTTFQE